jgi:hypothetical protein
MSVGPLAADIVRLGEQVRFVPILLQKSAPTDGRSAISLEAAGIDPSAPTLSTQFPLYAMH